MSEHLSKDSLAEGLHTKFRLSFEPEKMIELELVEVNESGDVAGRIPARRSPSTRSSSRRRTALA